VIFGSQKVEFIGLGHKWQQFQPALWMALSNQAKEWLDRSWINVKEKMNKEANQPSKKKLILILPITEHQSLAS